MRVYVEREDKYEVGEEFAVPDVVAAMGGQRAESLDLWLVNTYFDTPDGALRRRRVTLRRRAGDADEGWQLKIPHGHARLEIQMPLGDGAAPPPQLVEILTGLALGAPLEPVAAMTTTRRITRVLDATGAMLIEVDDDRVEADVLDETGRPTQWREVEVELGTAPPQALTAVRERMLDAGATIAPAASKLARVLGTPDPPTARSAAPSALADYLATQVDAILLGDVALRRGTDPIHDVRVAIRRLRSTLRVFAAMIEAPTDLDDELKHFAGLLGEVRDRDVQRRHFTEMIHTLDPKYVLGRVAADLDGKLTSEQVTARARVADAMNGERYLRLLAAVAKLATDENTAAQATPKRLRKATRRAARKADKRLAAALDTNRDELLHRARKAAKRARYAAELTAPVRGGKKAKRARKHYKRIQRVLGEHQDAVVAADTLWHAATRAGAAGTNGFTYGLLLAREQARADLAVAALYQQ